MKNGNMRKLYLLLWKNFTLHRRHKFRLVVEITLPLLLFVLLMVLRKQGIKHNLPECHFDEKALPSAGFWPFFQNTICTFNNTCHQSKRRQSLNQSAQTTLNFINSIVDDIEHVSGKYLTPAKIKDIETMFADVEAFSKLLRILTNPDAKVVGTIIVSELFNDTKDVVNSVNSLNLKFPPNVTEIILQSKFRLAGVQGLFDLQRVSLQIHLCNRDGISDLIIVENRSKWRYLKYKLCTLSESDGGTLFRHLMKNINWKNFYSQLVEVTKINVGMSPPSLETVLDNIDTFSNILKEMKELPSLYYITNKVNYLKGTTNGSETAAFALQLFQTFFCGRNSTTLFDPDNQGLERRFEELKEQMKESTKKEKDNSANYVYDNTTNVKCNELFEYLETNDKTQILWKMFKPFIRGKILYTPVTKTTTKIIKKVNETFLPLINVVQSLSEMTEKLSLMSVLEIGDENSSISLMEVANKMLSILNEDETYFGYSSQDIYDTFVGPNLEGLVETLNFLSDIADNLRTYLECIDTNRFEGVSDEKKIMFRGLELMAEKKFLAAIVFTDLPENDWELPTYIKYKIRMDAKQVESSKRIFDVFPKAGSRRRPMYDLKYLTFGYAFLQDTIDHSIIKLQTGTDLDTGVYMQQFPYPCYILDQFLFLISLNFSFFMTVAWLYTCSMITKGIVMEKELRLKEVMKIMGLENGMLWIAWFIESILIMIISCVFLAVIFTYGGILHRSDPTLIFVYLFSYCFATVMISFLLSTLFSNSNIAAVAGGTIFFFFYLPNAFLIRHCINMEYWTKFATSLLPSCAFGMGAVYISFLEENGEGAQWSNVGISPIPDDSFSLGHCIGMSCLDAVILMLIALYIEAVFPGQYGIARPWYYFVTKSYWFGSYSLTKDKINEQSNDIGFKFKDDYEDEPTNLNLGVSIQNLVKVYGNNQKKAVDNLSLNFYENQITSFLGHNGAGKTSTISMLIGLYSPTSGTAYINGYSITENMDGVRRSLGVCPQYNVLFDGLTVEEHLWFYGCLKGGSDQSVNEEMEELLIDLGLENKRKELASNLSGGMRRKLSIGIAFTAGSKTVILDEPTAGVDPCARRSIWELLIKYKIDRTIILTTHHMDEAELLGDRIAVIANGKLRCCGSSLFLKATYGKGYYLTMVKSAEKHVEMNGNYDFVDEKSALVHKPNHLEEVASKMEDFVMKYTPEGKLIENVGADMTFLIPKKYQEDGSLLRLLEALEKRQNYLPITSYGVSDSSFEEIFLRIADTAKEAMTKNNMDTRSLSNKLLYNCGNFISVLLSCLGRKKKKRPDVMDHTDGYTSPPPSPSKQLSGKWLYWQQFVALIIRRVNNAKRNYKGIFCEIALPVFFIIFSMGLTEFTAPFSEEPPIELHPWHFKPPHYVFYENLNTSSQSANSKVESLLLKPGLGNRCVKNNPIKKFECASNQFDIGDLDPHYNMSEANKIIDCSCSLGSIICPSEAGGPTPPSVNLATGDIVYNVTGRNISDWIIKTTKKYYMRRFGGFSFGLKNPMGEILDNILANISHRLIDPFTQTYNLTLVNDYVKNLRAKSNQIQPIENVRVWFNNRAWISSVTFLNSINNIILRSHLSPDKDPSLYGISVTNHPMKYSQDQVTDIIDDHGDLGFICSLTIIFALSFVPVSFIIFIIEDKSTGSKHLQYVSGLKPLLYWLSSFIWDTIKALFLVLLFILIFIAIDQQAYISDHHIIGFTTLLFLFCWACIPLMYIATNFFDSASAAFITLTSINLFLGFLTTISVYILRMLDNEVLEDLATVLDKIYLIFPHYCLGRGLMDLYSTHLMASVFADYGVDLQKHPFAFNFMGLNFLLLGLEGVIFFAIVIIIDYGIIRVKRYEFSLNNLKQGGDKTFEKCDQDVLEERDRARSAKPSDYTLLIQDLTKVYDPLKPPAVNKLCLTVRSGQCFGLLGVNGAGKTTTFKMLTGDTTVTSGDAFIEGYSIKSELEETCKVVGYCPQFDALDPLLTALEHLEFYARISGIPERSVKSTAYWAIKKLGLSQYTHIPSGTYSGGNKRKLSTAIALIGYPAVIFLDEPTTGMDPQSKRFLWNCILDVVKDGHCVILTSHSMEECEALCTRLAIMVSGQFRCLGSIQQLKNKYGTGYTVTLKASHNVEEVTEIMMETFGDCAILIEEHLKQLQYCVNSSLQLSFIFRQLEEFRKNSLIETYSLTQTTLEQVFVNFAREPTDNPTSLQLDIVPPKKQVVGNDEENPELIKLILNNGKAIYEVDRETVV